MFCKWTCERVPMLFSTRDEISYVKPVFVLLSKSSTRSNEIWMCEWNINRYTFGIDVILVKRGVFRNSRWRQGTVHSSVW